MGKAADNEAIKITANYYNNAAAGILVAGLFLPLLGLFARDELLVFDHNTCRVLTIMLAEEY